MGGGGGGDAPEPTPEERQLQSEQAELARLQRDMLQENLRRQDLLMPYISKMMGIEPQYDESGKITGYKELFPEESAMRQDVSKLSLERQLAALKGELPVSPGLERDIASGEETLREQLRKQLGTGFETSTPGIEALGDFGERANIIREGARRDELTLGQQLSLAAEASRAGRAGNIQPLTMNDIGSVGSVISSYDMPLRTMAENRRLQFMAQQQEADSPWGAMAGMLLGSMAGGAGMSIGGAIGAKAGTWLK